MCCQSEDLRLAAEFVSRYIFVVIDLETCRSQSIESSGSADMFVVGYGARSLYMRWRTVIRRRDTVSAGSRPNPCLVAGGADAGGLKWPPPALFALDA